MAQADEGSLRVSNKHKCVGLVEGGPSLLAAGMHMLVDAGVHV